MDGQLQAAEFKMCLGAMGGGVTSEFPQVLFSAIDKDKSGTISFAEFMNWLLTMTHGTDEEKLRYGFDLCDQNKDGRIDKADLLTTIEVRRCRRNRLMPSMHDSPPHNTPPQPPRTCTRC